MKTHEDKSFRRCALLSGQIKVNPDQVIAEALAILDNAKEEDLWYAGFVTHHGFWVKRETSRAWLAHAFHAREAKVGKQPQDDYLRFQIIMTIHPIEPEPNPQFLRLLEHILRDRELIWSTGTRRSGVSATSACVPGPTCQRLAAAFRDDSRPESVSSTRCASLSRRCRGCGS